MSRRKSDRWDRQGKRLQERILIWVRQGVPFDDVLAAALRRVDRAAWTDGFRQGWIESNGDVELADKATKRAVQARWKR